MHGSIIENLNLAAASARRLRGQPVYQDTLTYWGDLMREGRRLQQNATYDAGELLESAIVQLENELANRDL